MSGRLEPLTTDAGFKSYPHNLSPDLVENPILG